MRESFSLTVTESRNARRALAAGERRCDVFYCERSGGEVGWCWTVELPAHPQPSHSGWRGERQAEGLTERERASSNSERNGGLILTVVCGKVVERGV